jgi:hypothetical protein
MFRADFKCDRGHTQSITYDRSFTREMAEDHCTLMYGGPLHDIDMPGMGIGCKWPNEDASSCDAKVSFVVVEVP